MTPFPAALTAAQSFVLCPMKPSLAEAHPIEVLIFLFITVFEAIVTIYQCTPLLLSKKNQKQNVSVASVIGMTTTALLKVNQLQSPSTKSGTSSEVQKKVVGPTKSVSPSKPSASSPRRRQSTNSAGSTTSTKRTRTPAMTSA